MAGGGAAILVAAARKNRELIKLFREQRAISPDTATTAASLGVEEGAAWRRLTRHGIIRRAANGGSYLDQESLANWQSVRRKRVLLVGALAIALLLAGLIQLALRS